MGVTCRNQGVSNPRPRPYTLNIRRYQRPYDPDIRYSFNTIFIQRLKVT